LLAMHELTGDANVINTENDLYNKVDAHTIISVAKKILNPGNSSVLYYLTNK
jgi:hypothetical protein